MQVGIFSLAAISMVPNVQIPTELNNYSVSGYARRKLNILAFWGAVADILIFIAVFLLWYLV